MADMIIRTYQCEDCNWMFEVECESGSDGDPDCPNCSKVLQWIPSRVNIGTHKSKAIDLTQQVMEQDYGLADFNDRNREGDVAYKPPPPMQTSEREAIERAVREYVSETTRNVPVPAANLPPQAQAGNVDMNFWGGGATPGSVAAQPIATQLALAGAKQGPEANTNAVSMLQDSLKAVGPAGSLKGMTRVMSRWRP